MGSKEGLQAEIELNKLILLYILSKLGSQVNSISFSRIVLEKRYMNYYIMQHCLNNLWEIGFLERLNDDVNLSYSISDSGKQFLSYFSSKIPLVIRESIKNTILDIKDDLKKESEVITEYHEHENGGWILTCGVYENNSTILEIKALAGSLNEAHEICTNWKENISELYSDIMSVLLKRKN